MFAGYYRNLLAKEFKLSPESIWLCATQSARIIVETNASPLSRSPLCPNILLMENRSTEDYKTSGPFHCSGGAGTDFFRDNVVTCATFSSSFGSEEQACPYPSSAVPAARR
jgi:hypothetical protein